MQDRPTAVELVQAIREFLENEVAPELSGRKRFHMRVVHNLLNTLERELVHEEQAVGAEWERLASLLRRDASRLATFDAMREDVKAMNAELSSRIRDGAMDAAWDETLRALRETVREKLAIANPGYAEGPSSAT